MANTGPDTNTSHFSIMVDAAPHLNGHYTIFGEAVSGFEASQGVTGRSQRAVFALLVRCLLMRRVHL